MTVASGRFFYRARNPAGDLTEGSIVAPTARVALARLKHAGIRTIRLQSHPIRDRWWQREVAIPAYTRLTMVECTRLCDDLVILLKSGFEVAEALAYMQVGLPRKSRLARLIRAVEQRVRLGVSLTDGFKEDVRRLPPDFVPVLEAGEAASDLASALAALATSYRGRSRLRGTIWSALAYPLFLLAVVVFVLVIMATQVAPTIGRIFISANHPMPLVIDVMWQASQFCQDHLPLLLVVVCLPGLLVAALVATGRFGQIVSTIGLRLPVVGPMLRWSAASRFAASLRLAIETHLPISKALPRAIGAAGIFSAQQRDRAEQLIRQGSSLSDALRHLTALPIQLQHLIAIGERSTQLGRVLDAVEAEAHSQLDRRSTLLSTLLGPVMILIVGLIVGGLVYSVFSALMEINNLAS